MQTTIIVIIIIIISAPSTTPTIAPIMAELLLSSELPTHNHYKNAVNHFTVVLLYTDYNCRVCSYAMELGVV